MRCRPCGAPRNPSAEKCEYCQSWHDQKPRHVIDETQTNRNLQAQFQSQMMANQQQRQYQGHLMGNALGNFLLTGITL